MSVAVKGGSTVPNMALPLELVPNLNWIKRRIVLYLEVMQKPHKNPSPDSDPAVELKQH